MTERVMRRWAVVVGLCLWAVLCAGLAYFAGDEIEAALLPVIETAAGPVTTGPAGARPCWAMHVHKARDGAPEYVSYFVKRPKGGRIAITPYYAQSGELVATPLSRHPAGDRWTVEYCADLPPRLATEDGLLITGTIYYRTWHGLWLVPMKVPDVPLS